MKADKRELIWGNYECIAEIQKSDALKLVISASTRQGYRCVRIHEWYKRKADAEWKPGRDSVTFMLKSPLRDGSGIVLEPAEDILAAIRKAIDVAATMELYDETNAVYKRSSK